MELQGGKGGRKEGDEQTGETFLKSTVLSEIKKEKLKQLTRNDFKLHQSVFAIPQSATQTATIYVMCKSCADLPLPLKRANSHRQLVNHNA